jgi:ABC-2 type transport system permease protein
MKASILRIITIAGKEWLQILRDTRSLILALAAPLILLILFGYALTMDVTHVGLCVIDRDKSAASRAFTEKFAHTEYFDYVAASDTTRTADELFDERKISLAITIPSGFGKDIDNGKTAKVQVLVDGSDSTSANVSLGYASAVILSHSAEIAERDMLRKGSSPRNIRIEAVPRFWYNENMVTRNFILPGLTAVILAIICALIASLSISRENERGTLESILSTPVRPREFIFGKMIPYVLIGVLDTITCFVMGYFVFGLPIKGSFLALLLITVLFTGGMTSLGILISTVARTQVLSVQMSMIATYLPTFILSGFAFPIANMPAVIQAITHVIPARYLITVTKGIALKGVGTALVSLQIFFLAVFFIVITAAAIRKFGSLLPYRKAFR